MVADPEPSHSDAGTWSVSRTSDASWVHVFGCWPRRVVGGRHEPGIDVAQGVPEAGPRGKPQGRSAPARSTRKPLGRLPCRPGLSRVLPQMLGAAGMSARVHRSVEQVAGAGPRIPVLSLDSGVAGPVVCIGANLHGDESTGLGVVHALDGVLPRLLARGRVFLYPSLNPLGLEQGSRRMPGDGLDPNRAFPGSARGSRAERHADRRGATSSHDARSSISTCTPTPRCGAVCHRRPGRRVPVRCAGGGAVCSLRHRPDRAGPCGPVHGFGRIGACREHS